MIAHLFMKEDFPTVLQVEAAIRRESTRLLRKG
jgi:hypothetical protein